MKSNYKFFSAAFIYFAAFVFCLSETMAQGPFTGKPRYQILTTQNSATLGIIQIELFPNIAPKHVRNFDSLVNVQFYDTIAFHRVVPGFVIQGGDPNSRSGPVSLWGFGQSGQPTVPAEFSKARHERGIFSAARSQNINSATSQFFICVAAAPNLNEQYSVYGRVTSGMNVVDQIVSTPTVSGTQRPVQKIEMFITYIGSNDTVPQPASLIAPASGTVGLDTNVVILSWAKVQDAQFYHLDVARDSLFTDTVKSISTTLLYNNVTYMDRTTKYFWKVRANNGGHTSTSDIWNFTTAPIVVNTTGITNANLNDKKFSVFPNPTTDKFTFSNVEIGNVIEINDLSGRLVVKEIAKASQVTVSMGDAAKGTYLYKVSRGQNQVAEGKFILND